MGIQLNLSYRWLFSPWTVALSLGPAIALVAWSLSLRSFLETLHPWVLASVAVLLTVWLLFGLSPKLTLQVMRLLDITLPRGDSGVPFVGVLVRGSIVILGPALLYLSFMALREGAPRGWEITAAVFVGIVLGALSWRSISLMLIMREHYLEDEVRKGLLETGAYGKVAIQKLEQATHEILAEPNLDKRRIRLRRLAATDRVLRNRNYDPYRIQEGTAASATVGGIKREREVAWARRNLERIELQSDLGDEEVRTGIAEQRAKQGRFDSQSTPRRSRHGRSLEEDLEGEVDDEVSLEEAGDRILERKLRGMRNAGLPAEEVERRMSRLKARIAEIIARKMGEE